MRYLLFSYREEAITTWNFADGAWLHAPWETHELLVTDGGGYVTFTEFKGGYNLTTDDKTVLMELTEDVQKTVVI